MIISARARTVLTIMAVLAVVLPAGPLAQAQVPHPAPGPASGAARWTSALPQGSALRSGVGAHRSAARPSSAQRSAQSARTVQVGSSRVRVPTAGGMAIDEAARTLYVADRDGHRVLVLDLRGCSASRQHCQAPVGVIPVGATPEEMVVDPRTQTLYVSLSDAATVAVADVRRCQARDTSFCAPAAARVPVAGTPIGFGLDTRTRTLYVGNVEDRVSLIDTTVCNGTTTSGCGALLATVATGPAPIYPYVDAARSTVYVGNADGDTLSVIDTRACRRGDISGCGQTPVSVPVGAGPFTATVDASTDTLYVSNQYEGTISVLDAATCNALNTSSCARKDVPTIRVAVFVQAMEVVPKTHTLYAQSDQDTVAVVDLRHCQAHDSSGCGKLPRTLQTDAGPWELRLDRSKGSLYVSAIADGTVQVLDPRTCSAVRTSGCRRPAPTAPSGSYGSAVDPARHTLYQDDPENGVLLLVDTASCRAGDRSGCTPPLRPIRVGTQPGPIEIDPGTHTLYVGDFATSVVHVINSLTCNVTVRTGCAPLASIVVPHLDGLGINPSSHTVYVNDRDARKLYVLAGGRCNATDLSGCGTAPRSVDLGVSPSFPYVEPGTNTVYLPSTDDNGVGTLTLVDGSGCDRGTAACRVIATTTVGRDPIGIDVDPATHTLYTVINNDFNQPASLSLLDTRTCSARSTTGCATRWPTAPTVHASFGVTVDRSTHRVFNVASPERWP